MTWRHVAVQWSTVAVLLAIVLLLRYFEPGWSTVNIPSNDKARPAQQHGQYHAIDGDSFFIGKTEIRLYGVDAPEYRQICTDNQKQPHPCGRLAREQLSKLIGDASVSCTMLEQDRYGRQVSICWQGKLEINREMVRLGFAVAYRKHALDYLAVEADARNAKRGIWAWHFEQPEDYRARHRFVQGSLAFD